MGVGSSVWVAETSSVTNAATTEPASLTEREEAAVVETLPAVADRSNNFISDVAEAVGPAVVRIDATKVVATTGSSPFGNPSLRDPFFRRFFGDLPNSEREYRQRGQGSGFIISEDGKIITNAHVVDGATEVEVHLKDGRSYAGTVVGTDPLTNIAPIEIEADELPKVEIAVPINTAVDIARQLEETGTVEHTYLGIEMLALNPDVREQLNAEPTGGSFSSGRKGFSFSVLSPVHQPNRRG